MKKFINKLDEMFKFKSTAFGKLYVCIAIYILLMIISAIVGLTGYIWWNIIALSIFSGLTIAGAIIVIKKIRTK